MCVPIRNEVALLQGIFALKSALLTLFWACILHMLAEKIYNNYNKNHKKQFLNEQTVTSMLLEFFVCFTYILKISLSHGPKGLLPHFFNLPNLYTNILHA